MAKRVVILTTGSQGDVQPFLALSMGLQEAGYHVRIVANAEFETFVRGRGVDFADIGPNPNDAFPKLVSPQAKEFRKIYKDVYLGWMRDWMIRGVEASKDADVLVVAPVASVGSDVAEKLSKPFVDALYMPATPTRAFPNPNLPFNQSLGPLYNWLSHVAIDSVSWRAQRSLFNRLRRSVLDLPDLPRTTPERRKRAQQIPLLYGFSPSVVPKPHDWPEWAHVTGYWYLDTKQDWRPPADLVDFLDAGPRPIYLELGSLTVLVQGTIVKALRGLMETGCRVVVDPRGTDLRGLTLSDNIYVITKSVPHSWILPRVGAAITHGGPSTVAAVLRAGIPIQILPIFRGHSFWGHRTAELGVGLPPIRARRAEPDQIARSASILLNDRRMREKASTLGQTIRSEDGVARAVEVFMHYFPPSPTGA